MTVKNNSQIIKNLHHLRIALRYILGSVILAGGTLFCVGVIFFKKLPEYKNEMQLALSYETGYDINYDSFITGFNFGMPYVYIKNITISNPVTHKQIFNIKRLDLALSYASLWHLKPIFREFIISGSKLDITLDKNDNLYINQELISNLNQHSESHIDWQYYTQLFLLQKHLKISNIDMVFTDSKHDLIPLIINNFSLHLLHNDNFDNQIIMSSDLAHSNFNWELGFNGDKFDYSTWSYGNMIFHTVGNRGYVINGKSEVHSGEIDYIKVDFNSNQESTLNYSTKYSNLSKFNGNLSFNRIAHNEYALIGNHITIDTEDGYVLKNASITGKMVFEHGGFIDLHNLELDGLNSLLKYLRKDTKIHFNGDIDSVHVNWQGKMLNPQKLTANAKFSNLSLNSQLPDVPSFNNLSGIINTGLDSGNVTLQMQKSQISLPNYFTYPFKNIDLFYNATWKQESQNKISIDWQNSTLQSPDFKLSSSGNYNLQESSLTTKTTIEYINIANLYQYLPNKVDKATITDIQKNLSGYLQNIIIDFKGNLPYLHDNYIKVTGDIKNASYLYDREWPSIEKINGKFTLNNTKLDILLSSAKTGNLQAYNNKLSIADISTKNPTLNEKTEINASNQDYIEFLYKTPFKDEVNKLDQKVQLSGNTKIQLNTRIPIKNPKNFTIEGKSSIYGTTVTPKNESIDSLDKISGDIYFNQKQIKSANINALWQDSPIKISIDPRENIHFYAESFNYTKLISSNINSSLTQIINGYADTYLTYSMHDDTLKINSNLNNLIINAPSILAKPDNESDNISILVENFSSTPNISLNYNNLLFANALLSESYDITKLNVGLGTQPFTPSESLPTITLNTNLDKTVINEWADFVGKLVSIFASENAESLIKSTSAINEEKTLHNNLYPILVNWQSNSYWLNKYNFDGGNTQITLYPNLVLTSLNTPDISGRFAYTTEDNKLDINLDKLLLSSKNYHNDIINQIPAQLLESSIKTTNESISLIMNNESNSISYKNLESHVDTNYKIPTTNFQIKNLYLQNFYWGSLTGSMIQQNDDIFVENAVIKNNAAISRINIVTHCLFCNIESNQFIALNVHSDVNNFGNLLTKTSHDSMFSGGTGIIDVSILKAGEITDFDMNKIILYSSSSINNGVLVKVKPGLFGALMGVINLSSINLTSLNHFNFNSFFGQSFAFSNLNSELYLESSILHVDQLTLDGDAVNIKSFGKYYIESDNLDTYLTVQPKLASTIATTAGIVTLNPIIGGIVYVAQKLIGEPINQMLSISYHVNGNVESPNITQTRIDQQVIENFKSSIKLTPSDSD